MWILDHQGMYVYKNNKQGFTLIEVAVAIAIVGIGLLTVMSSFPLNLRATTSQSSGIQASYLAQYKIEEILGTVYDDLGTGTLEVKHDLGGSYAGFQRETKVSLVDSNLVATSTDVGLKLATVTVWWPRSYATQSVILKSIVSRR